MALLKKQPITTPAPVPSLAESISKTLDDVMAYIDLKVDELKATSDGSGLPKESLRAMLVKGECPCRVALRVLNE